jgi:REP element-mobilizing transposase RayT
LGKKFPGIKTDIYVVMPNHFHGIITLTEENQPADVGADLRSLPRSF